MFLPNRCLETGCITPLFYCCMRLLLSTTVSVAQPFFHGANTPQHINCRLVQFEYRRKNIHPSAKFTQNVCLRIETNFRNILVLARGHAVAQLVEGLCYKSEGHGFDSCWVHWIFNWPNPSSRIMTVGLTKPLTEMSTRSLPGGKGRPARKADLTAICKLTV
jgi:hypothetical protein